MDFRALRKLLRLTQAEAAALFGVGRTTWHNWERGEAVPGPALRLARLLMARPELAEALEPESAP